MYVSSSSAVEGGGLTFAMIVLLELDASRTFEVGGSMVGVLMVEAFEVEASEPKTSAVGASGVGALVVGAGAVEGLGGVRVDIVRWT